MTAGWVDGWMDVVEVWMRSETDTNVKQVEIKLSPALLFLAGEIVSPSSALSLLAPGDIPRSHLSPHPSLLAPNTAAIS